MDEKDIMLAKKTFKTLCAALDDRNWKYKADAEALTVLYGIASDNVPMSFRFEIDAGRSLVLVTSVIPLEVPEDTSDEVMYALTYINDRFLNDGNFDFSVQEDVALFRMTHAFHDSLVGKGLFEYLINYSAAAVQRYNEAIYRIAKGEYSFMQFVKDCEKDE